MRIWLDWTMTVTIVLWIVAEIALQVRQFRMGGKAKRNEWGSLGVIVVTVAIGEILAALIDRNVTAGHIGADHTVMLAISLPIVWAGLLVRLWSIVTLGRFFRGVVHVQEDHHVVRSGPYRVLRHPAYAGALLAVVGFGLTFRNVFALLVFVGCVLAGVCYRIAVEEWVLLAELGADYADYREGTSRLVPHVW